MKAIIPENFHIEAHMEEYPVHMYGFNDLKFNKDHALYILSQLSIAPVQDQQLLDNMDWEEGFIPLNAKRLQSHVRKYRAYLNYFIDTSVIECDNFYITAAKSPGKEKSYGYRFTNEYTSSDVVNIDYGKAWINTLKSKDKVSYKALQKEYAHLVKWLWPTCHIQIDYKAALEWITLKKKALNDSPELRDKKYNKTKDKYILKSPFKQFRFAKTNLLSVYQGDMYCHVDDTTNRMHTLLTTMKSILRNFLSSDGRNLTSADIKNCQPYVLTTLFNRESFSTKKGELNLTTFNENLFSKFRNDLKLDEAFFEAFNNEDVILYKSLVSGIDGNPQDLYQYMLEECQKRNMPYTERDEVKVIIFEVLFTANRYKSREKDLFQELFPTIDQLCRQIKKSDKANLACLLQSIESHMVLKVITKKIAGKYPNAHLYTIHDSIATSDEYIDYTVMVMKEELTKLTGLPPKLKIEKWSPAEVDWNMYPTD